MFNRGQSELEAGNYQEAIVIFREALANNPDKAPLWRGLGISYYRNSQYADAVDALKQAHLLAPGDGLTVLYLGMSYERLNDLMQAAKLYRRYLEQDPDSEIADKIKHRVKYLTDKAVQAKVEQVISSEKEIDQDDIPDNSVAVLGFRPGNLPDRYAPLARGLTEMLVVDLKQHTDLTLVERVMLQAILNELEMSQSDYFDKEKAPRVGRLIGAARVISGEVSQPDEDDIKLESGIIEVKEGFVEYPGDVEGELDQFFKLQKDLVKKIAASLGYPISGDEEAQLMQPPTESFLAFLSYSMGLEYADQGMFALAEAQFENALQEDPNFALAAQAHSEVEGLSNYDGSVISTGALEKAIISEVSVESARDGSARGLKDLQETIGYMPDTGEEEEEIPFTPPVVGTGTVHVTGTLDE
jgi:tetratricopeptide (TPR) repeat protein